MRFFILLFFIVYDIFGSVGSVTLLKGKATILREGVVYNIHENDRINKKDRIDTYKNTKLRIRLDDETIVTLGKNTKYEIESYSDVKNPHLSMKLFEGLANIVSGKIGKMAQKKFILKTKTAIIGIRGTHWKTFVWKNIENSVCLKGEIVIKVNAKIYHLVKGNMLLRRGLRIHRFKTNMSYFNKQVQKNILQTKKRIESSMLRQDIKKSQINTQKNNKIFLKNSQIKSNVEAKKITIQKNAKANIGNIEVGK